MTRNFIAIHGKSDPFKDEATFWPGGYGALTNVCLRTKRPNGISQSILFVLQKGGQTRGL